MSSYTDDRGEPAVRVQRPTSAPTVSQVFVQMVGEYLIENHKTYTCDPDADGCIFEAPAA